MDGFTIRSASEEDVPLLLALIREMADYERVLDSVEVTADLLRKHLFEQPCAETLVLMEGGAPAGYAVFMPEFSTFKGRPRLFLEDIYVRPHLRGRGAGRALMARLATITLEREWAYMVWGVLDWNEPAFGFYRKLGAIPSTGHEYMALMGDALRKLAAQAG